MSAHKGDETPQVSVLMTVWNGAAYLREAIGSIQAQTGDVRWELLLVDDGSTDESLRIALEAASADHRITVLRHAGGRNLGISASRNLALAHARAPVLAFLDADDVWLSGRLASQLPLLHAHPEAAMVYAAAERWYNHDAPFDQAAAEAGWWGMNYLPPQPTGQAAERLLPAAALLHRFLGDESAVPCICSVLVRTAAAREVGGFEDQFRGLYDDQAFHAKVSLRWPVLVSAACVARYRQHASSCCAEGREHAHIQQRERQRFERWLAEYRQATASAAALETAIG